MTTVEIRSIQRSRRRDQERTVIWGKMRHIGVNTAHPAGSYQLRHIDGILLGPDPTFAKRQVVGSVVDPQAPGINTYNNSVSLRTKITGSQGSRTTTLAQIGSNAGAGTAGEAYFAAFGV